MFTRYSFFFFFNATAPTEIYTLSLHDALPIYRERSVSDLARADPHRNRVIATVMEVARVARQNVARATSMTVAIDRKSTRLNSSHMSISYAVFCLKKKKQTYYNIQSDAHMTIN